jgi:RNA recognition motif-containing protein
VRLAPKNFAFIEYKDEFKAEAALALNGIQFEGATLQVSYAKK